MKISICCFLLIIVAAGCDNNKNMNFVSANIDGSFWYVNLDDNKLDGRENFISVANYFFLWGIKQTSTHYSELDIDIQNVSGLGRYKVSDLVFTNRIVFISGDSLQNAARYLTYDSSGFLQITRYDDAGCEGVFECVLASGTDTIRLTEGSFRIEQTPHIVIN